MRLLRTRDDGDLGGRAARLGPHCHFRASQVVERPIVVDPRPGERRVLIYGSSFASTPGVGGIVLNVVRPGLLSLIGEATWQTANDL